MSALFFLAAAYTTAQPTPAPRPLPKHVKIFSFGSTKPPDALASLMNKAVVVDEPKTCATMRMLPFDPNVDPKFVIKLRKPSGKMPVFRGIPPCSIPNP
jgi:hypothetical protein